MITNFLDFSNHHTVAWSSDLLATEFGDHIYNVKMAKNHDNGVVLGLGDFIEYNYFDEKASSDFEGVILMEEAVPGMYQIFVTKAADGDILILSVPEGGYDFESEAKAERQYFNGKGEIARAYQLRYGDRFSISKEGFTTEPDENSIGKKVTANADGKLVIGA